MMPRDRTPPPKDLSDTGKEMAAVAEDLRDDITDAFNTALRQRRGEVHAQPQQPPKRSESSEDLKKAHRYDCMNEPAGPGCQLSRRLDDIEQRVDNMEKDYQQRIGRGQVLTKTVAVIGAAAAIISAMIALSAFARRDAQAAPMQALADQFKALQAEIRAHTLPAGER